MILYLHRQDEVEAEEVILFLSRDAERLSWGIRYLVEM